MAAGWDTTRHTAALVSTGLGSQGARTLLGAPGIATSNKGIATRSKGLTTRNKKLVEKIYKLEFKLVVKKATRTLAIGATVCAAASIHLLLSGGEPIEDRSLSLSLSLCVYIHESIETPRSTV